MNTTSHFFRFFLFTAFLGAAVGLRSQNITISASPDVISGDVETFVIDLDVAAPAGGLDVTIVSSDAQSKADIGNDGLTTDFTFNIPAGSTGGLIDGIVEVAGIEPSGEITLIAVGDDYNLDVASFFVLEPSLSAFGSLTVPQGDVENTILTRPSAEDAGELVVTVDIQDSAILSTTSSTFTFPAGVNFIIIPFTGVAEGSTTVTFRVGSYQQVELFTVIEEIEPELEYLAWVDRDDSSDFSAGDFIYLSFNIDMDQTTVTLGDLLLHEFDGANWGLNPTGTWGAGATIFPVDMNGFPITEDEADISPTDSATYKVTLGTGVDLGTSGGVLPTNFVLDTFGNLDQTPEPIAFPTAEDTNADGLPDYWYINYDLNPAGTSVAGDDLDGDTLTNAQEFALGSDPDDAFSLDGTNTLTDADFDSDGDGLSNLEELNIYFTSPLYADSDDDGVDDNTEIGDGSNPLDPYDQGDAFAVDFDGDGRLLIQTESDVDLLRNWTVEAWVNPRTATTSGIIARRIEQTPISGVRFVDYELGLDSGVPYASYTYRTNTGFETVRVEPDPLILNGGNTLTDLEWAHVAGVLDMDNQQFRLYVNGHVVGRVSPVSRPETPVTGPFESTIGGGDFAGTVSDGFDGQLDAVRIWDYARGGLSIQGARGILLPEFSNGLPVGGASPIRMFNFDTNGIRALNDRYPNDFNEDWIHAAIFQGTGAVRTAQVFPPEILDTDDDTVSDMDERTLGLNELRSDSPFLPRALRFDGTGEVVVDELVDSRDTRLYALEEWTLETWVRPAVLPTGDVSLLRREGEITGRKTFELGLRPDAGALKPFVRFNRSDSDFSEIEIESTNEIPVAADALNPAPDEWTHLAATFSQGTLSLYVNGVVQRLDVNANILPWTDERSKVYLGEGGFEGDLQESRIWNFAKTTAQVIDQIDKMLLFSSGLLQQNFDGSVGPYLGRETDATEDGYVVDYTFTDTFLGQPFTNGNQTHRFSIGAWVRLEPDSAGGMIASRVVDLNTAGGGVQDFRFNHGIGINAEGRPVGVWAGQVTEIIAVTEGDPPVTTLETSQIIRTTELISDVDIRDGNWYHIMLVGDSQNVRLYLNGALDRQTRYYNRRALENGVEGLYFTYSPIGSSIRIAEDPSGGGVTNVAAGFDGLIDEVALYNIALSQEEIEQLKDFGLTRSEFAELRLPISPLPDNAIDDGRDHVSLVSYLTFDGELDLPFVSDFANESLPFRILPQVSEDGSEIDNLESPPVDFDTLQPFFSRLPGYFPGVDSGFSVENFLFRNDYRYAGIKNGGVEVIDLGLGANDVVHVDLDTNNDGIPDWWYILYGLDPSGDSVATADWDADGLPNLYEFLFGSDPNDAFSVDPSGTTNDGLFDADGDGLSSVDELTIHGTNPSDPDTDDDGFSDGDELNPTIVNGGRSVSSPVYSRSPFISRSMVLDAATYIVPDELAGADRFALSNWTIEAWIQPATASETGIIISRLNEAGRISFELGLTANLPYVSYQTAAGTAVISSANAGQELLAGEWAHIAGIYDSENDSLELYINGQLLQSQATLEPPSVGTSGTTTLGTGLNGFLDELRVWTAVVGLDSLIATADNHLFDFGTIETPAAIDLVFVIDTSASMGPFIDQIRANVSTFVQNLEAEGLDVALGGVRYSDSLEGGGGPTEPPPSGSGLFTSATEFIDTFLNPLTPGFGGDLPEDGLGGLTLALNGTAFTSGFRSGAAKVFVLVTDASVKDFEDGDNGALLSRAAVIEDLIANEVTVLSIDDGAADVAEIVASTGGSSFNINLNDYSTLLDDVATTISSISVVDDILAYYTFDDSENTTVVNAITSTVNSQGAEDFNNELNFDLAIQGITFSDVEFAPVVGNKDLNANDLPDWWETLWFGSATVNPDEDPDGDGIPNRFEFRLDTNPKKVDSNGDGVADGAADEDGDGLTNAEEVVAGTNLFVADTDDDGLNDLQELQIGTSPVDDVDPLLLRHLRLDGTGVITIPNDAIADYDVTASRFDLSNWTLEAAVRLSAAPTGDAIVIQRTTLAGHRTFELGVNSSLQPYVLFDTPSGTEYRVTATDSIALGEWTHLAGKFGPYENPNVATRELSLYVDGVQVKRDPVNLTNALGYQQSLTIGTNLTGDLDEVRIWRSALPGIWIDQNKYRPLLFGRDSVNLGALQPNQGSLTTTSVVPQYTMTTEYTLSAWFRTTSLSGDIIAMPAGTAFNGDTVFNYRVHIQDGRIFGDVSFLYTGLVAGTGASRFGTISLDSGQSATDNQWRHVAMVVDSTNNAVNLYVNGTLRASSTIVPPPGNVIWHPDVVTNITSAALASGSGLLEIGNGLVTGEIDEVFLQEIVVPGGTINSTFESPAEVESSTRMLLNFDFHDPNQVYVDDLADVESEALEFTGNATILSDGTSNAPLEGDNRDFIINRMSLYLSFNDGQGGTTPQPGYTLQDHLFPRTNVLNYTATSGIPSGGWEVIDLLGPDYADFAGPTYLSNPDFFNSLPIDSPYRTDADGDGMPDLYEIYYGFDPDLAQDSSNPELTASGDLDGDGLTNYQEYLAGTDPTFWDSDSDGLTDTFELDPSTGLTLAETYLDGDFLPDDWERTYLPQLSSDRFDAFADTDFDGWNNLEEFLGGSNPLSDQDVPRPRVEVRVDWEGAVAGTVIRWIAWDNAEMDGNAEAAGVVTPGVGDSLLELDVDESGNPVGALPSDPVYILVYADLDGSGTWNTDAQGLPEPAGFPQELPLRLGSGTTTGLRVGLEVEPVGYRRIHWTPVDGQSSYDVQVIRRTTGSQLIFDRTIEGRSYIHDWDFKLAGMLTHLDNGNSALPQYEIYVDGVLTPAVISSNDDPFGGIFDDILGEDDVDPATRWGKDWTEPLSAPSLNSPTGIFGTIGGSFNWTVPSGNPTRFRLEIRAGSSSGFVAYQNTFAAPVPNPDGSYSFSPELFATGAGLADGVYVWRVIAQQPGVNGLTTTESEYATFQLNTLEQPNGPYTISGEVIYMGRVDTDTANFIVQAFTTTSIFGTPFNQTTITEAGHWRMTGLPGGNYYFKVFMDVNGSGTQDLWEPMGLLKSPDPFADDYVLKSISVGPGSGDHEIVVVDLDTDNDSFSDAWEQQTFGSLTVVNVGDAITGYPDHSTVTGDAFGTTSTLELSHLILGQLTILGDNLFQDDDLGLISFGNMGLDLSVVWSYSLQTFLQILDTDKYSSEEYGDLEKSDSDSTWVSSNFGFFYHDPDVTAPGWFFSERFDWSAFVWSGSEPYLWSQMIKSWMAVQSDGSFFSFVWGELKPLSLDQYDSPIFGTLTLGDFDTWVFSERFGWMWPVGDGIWFWSEGRQEWLGVTPGGGIWSTAENRFL